MDEEAEWQTPKRRKTATPKRLVSPETGANVASDNPFSPLAARTTETRDQEKSPKAERPPPLYIKNVTNVNALLKNITMINTGDFFTLPVITDLN